MLALMATSSFGFLHSHGRRPAFSSQLNLFDKLFEEEGILGKGITVGKVQVALMASDRSSDSFFGVLETHATDTGDAPEELSRMANEVCLELMRKSDDWVAACSSSKWFSEKDAGKAEGYYNDLSNAEAVKYEKVRITLSCSTMIFYLSLIHRFTLSGVHSR
jgi:hypothetical protein